MFNLPVFGPWGRAYERQSLWKAELKIPGSWSSPGLTLNNHNNSGERPKPNSPLRLQGVLSHFVWAFSAESIIFLLFSTVPLWMTISAPSFPGRGRMLWENGSVTQEGWNQRSSAGLEMITEGPLGEAGKLHINHHSLCTQGPGRKAKKTFCCLWYLRESSDSLFIKCILILILLCTTADLQKHLLSLENMKHSGRGKA